MPLKMTLEGEIKIVQFGQGVRPLSDLQASFSRLDDEQKKSDLFDLTSLVHLAKAVDADIEQAIAASGLESTDAPVVFLRSDRLRINRVFILPEEILDKAYTLQLHLFKTAYKRRYALEQGNLAHWWFWDLSQSEVVQTILRAHEQLVEEVYNDPGYRSEFDSLAKLMQADEQMIHDRFQEPSPEKETHFTFLNYDEMLSTTLKMNEENEKYSRPIGLLRRSLGKALSKKYNLDLAQEIRLMGDVLEKHKESQKDGLP
ncbi:hypothetical protein GCM10027347_26960 [Larkinella harenae]